MTDRLEPNCKIVLIEYQKNTKKGLKSYFINFVISF
ncbi:Uncharacterised protein [Candidatus Ornithobacterium hominis]|nr:Uncharacterised protein [Candidatus Ornithobacterium hominis]